MNEDEVGTQVVDAAIAVHRVLGPGLLESVYVSALGIELAERNIRFEREVAVQGQYRGKPLGIAYRADLLVEGIVLIEAKAVQTLEPVHLAPVLSYLRLSGLHLGYLLNFHAPVMKNGIKRVVNRL